MVDETNTPTPQPVLNLKTLSNEELAERLSSTNLRDLIIEHYNLQQQFDDIVRANAELTTYISNKIDIVDRKDARRYQLITEILAASDDESDIFEQLFEGLNVPNEEHPSKQVLDELLDAALAKRAALSPIEIYV